MRAYVCVSLKAIHQREIHGERTPQQEVTENCIDTAVGLRVEQSCALSLTVKNVEHTIEKKKKEKSGAYSQGKSPCPIQCQFSQYPNSAWKFAFRKAEKKKREHFKEK